MVLKNLFRVICGIFIVSAYGGGFDVSASDVPDEYKKADLVQGGLLYDNWPKLIGQKKLEGNHPLYPESSKKKGVTTWRCKECHGWDYIGKDGRYKNGSHFTGISGIDKAKEKPAKQVYASLTNTANKHDFSAQISGEGLWALTRFIKEGVYDIAGAINADGKSLGDLKKGKTMFMASCAECHGAGGNEFDFESEKEGIQGVGFLANDNPQETLHKILWGNPDTDMPSLIVDDGKEFQDAVDILSFAQTLK
jgi:mono/diheme cytochrome c family protein